MCPLSIPTFGGHIRNTTELIYVCAPFCATNGVQFRVLQGPKTRQVLKASKLRSRNLDRAFMYPVLLSQLSRPFHSFVLDVGVKLAAACQRFASPYLTDSSLSLSNLISSSQTTKARLLHYFPPSPGAPLPAENEPVDSWCGFHVDHSLLTGLCSVCPALLSVILK
jgi:hypothetical protein